MFTLDDNVIKQGENQLVLTSNYKIDSELVVTLSRNNNKERLAYTQVDAHTIHVSIDAPSYAAYKLLVRNNHELSELNLTYQVATKPDTSSFDSTLSYSNGMLYLHITRSQVVQYPVSISITGDLSHNTTWKVGERVLTIPFIKTVTDVAHFTYSINGQLNGAYVINKDVFPKAFIKTSKGVKLNASCGLPLVLVAGDTTIQLEANQKEVAYTWSGNQVFKLYCNEQLLFEQMIQGTRSVPKLVIAQNPFRLKIGFATLENVEVSIKGLADKLILEAGKTELEFTPPNTEDIVEIEVLNVINVKIDQTIWRF
jgi:hypothetical protein